MSSPCACEALPADAHALQSCKRQKGDRVAPVLGQVKMPWFLEATLCTAFSLYTAPLGSTMGALCSFMSSRVMLHTSLLCTCLDQGRPSASFWNFCVRSHVQHTSAPLASSPLLMPRYLCLNSRYHRFIVQPQTHDGGQIRRAPPA